MSSLLQPLRLMVYRRQCVIATASLQFYPAESRHAGASVGVIQLPKSDGIRASNLDTIDDIAEDVDQGHGTRNDTVKLKPSDPLFIETKYGIRLDIAKDDAALLNVSETSLQAIQEPVLEASAKANPTLYHYRLFPDWQTSYLWHDLTKHTDLDDPYIDFDDIEKRYPQLSPYYEAWRQVYETQFEKAECHLGSGAEVFSDLDDRIAWDVEGFFLACWLVLRDDVQSIEYIPRSKKYKIEKGIIEKVLLEFLQDITKEKHTIDKS